MEVLLEVFSNSIWATSKIRGQLGVMSNKHDALDGLVGHDYSFITLKVANRARTLDKESVIYKQYHSGMTLMIRLSKVVHQARKEWLSKYSMQTQGIFVRLSSSARSVHSLISKDSFGIQFCYSLGGLLCIHQAHE